MPLRVFRCPSCNDVINTSMTTCRYCGAAIDPAQAAIAADLQEKANQAGVDAGMIKQMAIWMGVAIPFSLVPFVGMIGVIGYFLLIFALPIFILRWWMKYRGIQINDRDYKSAKATTLVALGAWAVLLVFALPFAALVSRR